MQTASAFSSVQGALSFFITIYRQLAEWQAVVNRLDGFEAGIAQARELATRNDRIHVTAEAGGRRYRPQGIDAAPAERHAAGERRRVQSAQGRAHAGHRPVRLRQIDAVPRHRRHLAVRRGLDRRPGGGDLDDAAAAAVLPDRIAARGGRLPRQGRHLHREPDQQALEAGRTAQAGVADPTNKGTGTGCCRSASSSASGSRARCCMRRNYLFLDEATASLDEPSEAALYRLLGEKLPATTIVSIGHRSTLDAFHQRNVSLVPRRRSHSCCRTPAESVQTRRSRSAADAIS